MTAYNFYLIIFYQIVTPRQVSCSSFRKVRNNFDLRRDKLKLDLIENIDEYYVRLQTMIDDEYNSKCNEFNGKIEHINSIEDELKNLEIFSSKQTKSFFSFRLLNFNKQTIF